MARPRVHLNCAASLNGRIAARDGSPLRLSDDVDMRRVHALRASCGAIVVGIGTVLADDPSLRVKRDFATGADPVRVVLDTRGRIPAGARLLDGAVPTMVVTGPRARRPPAPAEHLPLPLAGGRVSLEALLAALHERGVGAVLVEGGGTVLRAFLQTDLWDDFTLFQAPVLVGGGPSLWPRGTEDDAPDNTAPFPLRVASVRRAGLGVLWRFVQPPARLGTQA